MLGVVSVLLLFGSFLLYWMGGGHPPFTWQGLAILGIMFLAGHVTYGWWQARHP